MSSFYIYWAPCFDWICLYKYCDCRGTSTYEYVLVYIVRPGGPYITVLYGQYTALLLQAGKIKIFLCDISTALRSQVPSLPANPMGGLVSNALTQRDEICY